MYKIERNIIPSSIKDILRLAKRYFYPYITQEIKEVTFGSVDKSSNFNAYIHELAMFYGNRPYGSGFRLLQPYRNKNNYRKELSILEAFDNYMLVTTPDEVSVLKEYRKTLIEYDKTGLLTKQQKGYAWGVEYWEMMFAPQISTFTHNFNMFIDILRHPTLRDIVSDRLRYYDFNADNPLLAVGLTPNVLTDYILNHPYMENHPFTGLKNPRLTILEYLKQKDIPVFYYDEEADDIDDTKDSLMMAFLSTVTVDDLSKSYGYIECLLCSIYLSNYTQWVDRIRLGGGDLPRFTVHHHQILREVFVSEDYLDVRDIDWSKHPKDNFKDILSDIELNHDEMMSLVKAEADRRPINIPHVTELVTARDMVNIGEYMNICIGGERYVNQLALSFKNFYVIGTGHPKDKIVIEVLNRNSSPQILQVVTESNAEVTEDHKYYQTYLQFQKHLGYEFSGRRDYLYTLPGNIQQDVINQMRLIGNAP